MIDYSEKSLLSDKGTGLLPDYRRNRDKLLLSLSLSLSLISVALNSEYSFRF